MPGDDPGTPEDESGGADPAGDPSNDPGGTPTDPSQDDTLGEEDEGQPGPGDLGGFSEDVGMQEAFGITPGDMAHMGYAPTSKETQAQGRGKDQDSPDFMDALSGLLEAGIYGLTFGIVDPEFTGKDVFGPDISRGLSNVFGSNVPTTQPVGVELGLPVGVMPGLAGLGLSMATPTVSIGKDGMTAYGGTLGLLGSGNEVDLGLKSGGNVMMDNYKKGGEVQEYGLGGLVKSLLPMGLGYLAGPFGYLPAMAAGGLGSYVAAGGKRSFSDAIKGAMLGVSGAGMANLGSAANAASAGGADLATEAGQQAVSSAYDKLANVPLNANTWTRGFTAEPLQGLGKLVTEGGMSGLGAGIKTAALPVAAGLGGLSMTTPAEMPTVRRPEIGLPRAKTEEERKALAYKGLSPFTAQSFVPANVYSPSDYTPRYTAAQGGETPKGTALEEGSFVIPADVVSDIGDGNTANGFAKLDRVIGSEPDGYNIGGAIRGTTGGLDDLRQTTIEGKKAAAISDGEYVVSQGDVQRLGGPKQLHQMMDQVRMAKHGTTQQPQQSITMQGLRNLMMG